MIRLNHERDIRIEVKRMSGGKIKEETYVGVPVREMRDNWKGIFQVEFTGRDGMVTALSAEEIKNSARIILAEEPDGAGVRLIVGEDGFGRRWCRHVETIRYVEE
ncbi:MAG: hypothetical protein ACOX8E_10165 [Ruminococcus sp.]